MSRRGQLPILFLGLLCLLLSGAASAARTGRDIVRDNAKDMVVMIDGTTGSSPIEGAGIIVGSDPRALFIATADHVVREGDDPVAGLTVRFRWSPQQKVPATLLPNRIARSAASERKAYDLAVLRVARSAVPELDLDLLPLERVAGPATLERGADLYFLGYPQGKAWYGNVTAAKFAEDEGELLTFETVSLLPGYSGGALLDADLMLVGLIVDTEGTFGTAISIDAVAKALKGWGIPSQLGQRPASYSFKTITAGFAISCGLIDKGFAFCWSGGAGATTKDDTAASRRMERIPGGIRFTSLSAGPYHVCGITSSGEAFCFGSNLDGKLGSGSPEENSVYFEPVAGNLKFRAIAAGMKHSCGLTIEGKAYCWGAQWGSEPVAVRGDMQFDAISAGDGFSCALAKGRAWCWGQNDRQQLGYTGKNSSQSWTPIEIPMDAKLSLKQISSGYWHSCATASDGQAICWGSGYGTGNSSPQAAAIPKPRFLSVTAGEQSTCGIAIDRTAWCWGLANFGALGGGWTAVIENRVIKDEIHWEPVAVHGGHKFRALSAGFGFACGVTDRSELLCWGRRKFLTDYAGDYGVTPQPVPH